MDRIKTRVRQHPLVTYFVLAYALAWMLTPLVISESVAFGLLALFGPAIAAIIVTSVVEGRAGVSVLLWCVVQWRIGLQWKQGGVSQPFPASAFGSP
jgi:hypothetical protein